MLHPLIFINYVHSLLLAFIYPLLLTADLFTSCPVNFSFHALSCSPRCLGVSWLMWIYFLKIKSELLFYYLLIYPLATSTPWGTNTPWLGITGLDYVTRLFLSFLGNYNILVLKIIYFECWYVCMYVWNFFVKQEYRENFRARGEEAEVIKV